MSSSLGERLRESISKHLPNEAIHEPGRRGWSYEELQEEVEHFGRLLQGEGIDSRKLLGICLPKCFESVCLILSCVQRDIIFVPCDNESPIQRIVEILRSCEADGVVIRSDHLPLWEEVLGSDHEMATFDTMDLLLIKFRSKQVERPKDLSFMLYTSGSTGKPKGVKISERNALAFIDWTIDELIEQKRHQCFSSIAPFHFDLSVFDLYASLLTGGRLILFDSKMIKNPRLMSKTIADEQIQVIYATPTLLRLLLDYGKLDKLDFSSLRLVLFAGEVFPIEPLNDLRTKWSNAEWINLYGPTETNVVTYYRLPSHIEHDRTSPYPIGKVCPYADYYIHADATDFGEGSGELMISGSSLTSGYYGIESDSFMVKDGVRWYNTGDIVAIDENADLVFVGRRDGMIKRRGYRIELGEIDSCYSSLKGIAFSIAFVISCNDENRIVLAYKTEADINLKPMFLKEFGAEKLPSYMLPDYFLQLDDVPLTSSQKADIQLLKRIANDKFCTK